MLLGGTSLVLLWRISTTNRDVFSFLKLWSLYPATLGQAIPSAFGQLGLALTLAHCCRHIPGVRVLRTLITFHLSGIVANTGFWIPLVWAT